ncbi:MAG: hypothetical protein EOP93_23225, partial [Lysobacteraceae bacterium]
MKTRHVFSTHDVAQARSAVLALQEQGITFDDIFLVRFNMIGQLSFQRYCALIRPEDEIQPLSNRELEVLQWIA